MNVELVPTVLAASVSRTGPSALWYLSRGTGVVSLLLLTGSVVLGILESFRWTPRGWPRFSVAVLHRDISLLALAFIGAHIVTVVLDGFAPIAWRDAVIPFVSTYRPLWLGMGALAFDLVFAVTVSSLLRRHMGYRSWRALHWLAYASWPVAVVHGLGTGTDTRVRWILALNAACVGLVVLLLLRRLTMGWPHRAPARVFAGAVTAIAPVIVGAWLAWGPLQPGWAKVAGTPPSLLAASSTRAASHADRSQTSTSPSQGSAQHLGPFEGTLAGSIQQRSDQEDQLAVVEIQTVLSGGASGRLQIVLRGVPLSGGGVSVVSSRVTLAIDSGPTTYRGQVVALDGDSMVASLTSYGHPDLQLSVRIQFDQVPGDVTGVVEGRFTSRAGEGN